ncbi:ATP-dependent DNA helicase tlh1 [Purpureocillium lavendulum]|uniref:ATP-dependent DNA helicase tlh1 n=1 Tax=Purpureocillium lavendulum TaxID=1247861 RepID=A0AB34FC19_9HYPO|nr:ATP-dependent DNA helicase tlh1 [Purpureocillium lavendulum]
MRKDFGWENHGLNIEIDNRAEEPVEDASPPEIPSAYQEWADVFSEEEAAKLPPLSGRSHPIDLEEGQIPPSGPIYNLSEHELAVLREYIASAQKKGWIRRSISPAGSPILFVPKKGGQLRLCVDYRGLNKITKKNRTALPLISAILDRLGRAKLFTKLDLKDAYHRLRIRQGDEWKTAFRCHYGHYEYQVMPFGLVNAPASFQQYINDALEGLVDITCVVYLDDILIFSEHAEQHEDDVKEVLRRLRKAGLYANLRKCEFSVRRVSFLGFVIDDEGIHMEEERVRAVAEWPAPRCVKDIQVFLGFTGFYRRFIKNYSRIVSPLTDCLGKRAPRPWLLEPRAVRAFEDLKTAFQNGPILKHFDPSKPIRIETDASQFAIGAIISQLHYDRWHPVAFLSRKLQDAETRYAVPDCELLAITEAFRQWRHYLAYTSQKITVLTDHLNHKYFLSKPKLTNRQVNALDQLCSFDFEIVYRPGLKNPADGLSRRPDHEDFMEIAGLRDSQEVGFGDRTGSLPAAPVADGRGTLDHLRRVARVLRTSRTTSQEEGTAVTAPALQETLQEALLAAQRGDAFVAQQKQLVSVPDSATAGKLSSEAWSTNDEGFLCYDKRIFVPAGLRNEILILFHDDEVAGHQGGTKTCKRIQAQYYWPGLRRDVRRYVSTCRECQLAKPRHHKPYGLLAPLPAPERPWQEISMDFITDLPTVRCEKKTYSGILVVVDRLTRYGRFIPVSARITSDGLATVFLREIFRRLSTAFHPQTDGQTERINQTIEQYLRTFCNKEQSDWIDKLPMAEFTYNTSYHGTVKAAPAEVLMGYQPRSKGHVKGQLEAFSPNAMGRVRGLRELHERTALLIGNAQERQAHYYNKGREPKSFHEGDWVLISTKHLPLRRPTKKLTEKYVGPYQIERVIGGHKLAYRLRLPSTVRIHNVLPMSSLEPYLSRDKRPVEPEDNPFMAETTYDVEQILDHPEVLTSNKAAVLTLRNPRQQSGQQYVDSMHETIDALRDQGNAVTVTWVPVSREHGLLKMAKDEARDATREGATPAAKFPRARSTTLGIARAKERADNKIPNNVGDFTKRIDGALPGKHTRQLYDQLTWKEANVLAQLRTGMARLNDYLYRIKATASQHGGHGYFNGGSCTGIMLDLSLMNKASIKENSLILEPGCVLGQTMNILAEHRKAVPHGDCFGVGAGGHFTTAGWDLILSRRYGLGCQSLIGGRIALWDGSASDPQNSNLVGISTMPLRLYMVV